MADSEIPQTLEAFGMKVPLPKWAATIVAVLVLFGTAATIYRVVVTPHIETDARQQQLITQLLSEKAVQDKEAQIIAAESAKHFDEKPEGMAHVVDGKLDVEYFKSDGCLRVVRIDFHPNIVKWLLNQSAVPQSASPGQISDVRPPVPERPPVLLPAVYDPQQLALRTIPTAYAGCKGRCLQTHPGAFATATGQRRDCWVQVLRTWQDGCQQYQWFNSCYSYWDEDAQHHAKVFWTCCNH
jgi:hypothetical protein